jgi:hypothetical protein
LGLQNTIKPFTDQEYSKVPKNLPEGGTLKILIFKILSMRCIKLSQKTLGGAFIFLTYNSTILALSNYPKNQPDEESSGEEYSASGKKNWSEDFSTSNKCDFR